MAPKTTTAKRGTTVVEPQPEPVPDPTTDPEPEPLMVKDQS